MATSIISIALVIVATIIGAFGALYLKLGSATAKISFNVVKNSKLVLGFVLYGISSILFIAALRSGELSVLYPFVSFSYVWIALLSMKFLKEKMNLWKWAGIAAIVLGVSLIGFGS